MGSETSRNPGFFAYDFSYDCGPGVISVSNRPGSLSSLLPREGVLRGKAAKGALCVRRGRSGETPRYRGASDQSVTLRRREPSKEPAAALPWQRPTRQGVRYRLPGRVPAGGPSGGIPVLIRGGRCPRRPPIIAWLSWISLISPHGRCAESPDAATGQKGLDNPEPVSRQWTDTGRPLGPATILIQVSIERLFEHDFPSGGRGRPAAPR